MNYNPESFTCRIISLRECVRELGPNFSDSQLKMEKFHRDSGLNAKVIAVTAHSPEAAQVISALQPTPIKDEEGKSLFEPNGQKLTVGSLKLAEQLDAHNEPTVYFRGEKELLAVFAGEGVIPTYNKYEEHVRKIDSNPGTPPAVIEHPLDNSAKWEKRGHEKRMTNLLQSKFRGL